MEYAAYVEEVAGKNVLASARLLAESLIKEDSKQIVLTINLNHYARRKRKTAINSVNRIRKPTGRIKGYV